MSQKKTCIRSRLKLAQISPCGLPVHAAATCLSVTEKTIKVHYGISAGLYQSKQKTDCSPLILSSCAFVNRVLL